nr:MAG: maturation protein [Hangzhou atkins-like virus 3]
MRREIPKVHRAMSRTRDLDPHWRSRSKSETSRRTLKALAGTWLEYAFGLSPIFMDLDDIRKTLARPQVTLQPVWAKRHMQVGVTLSPQQLTYNGMASTTKFIGVARYSCKVKGAVGFDTSASDRMLRDWGLTYNSWAPTVWELLPYSWLFDYVSNLGDIVQAVSFPKAYLRWVHSTVRFEGLMRSYTSWDQVNDNYKLVGQGAARHVWRNKRVVRTSTVDFSPEFQLDLGLSARQAINSTAWMLQKLRNTP